MSNFDLTKYLAEGKLYEAMSPQDVVDIADTVAEEFTKESADKGDFMVYSVGEMDVDDMSFELDTDTTAQTPERILKMSNLGVGEGWGGSFRINPKREGYEVRNAEKGGLVAIIDNMGNFRMLSADESKAEMGRAKGEETDYMERRRETDDYMQEGEEKKSNKMKKSELKEDMSIEDVYNDAKRQVKDIHNIDVPMDVVKQWADNYQFPYSREEDPDDEDNYILVYDFGTEERGDFMEWLKDNGLREEEVKEIKSNKIPAEKLFALIARDLKFSPLAQDGVMLSKEEAIEIMRHVIAIEQSDISPEAALGEYIANGEFEEVKEIKSNKMKKSELKEMIKAAMMAETSVEETLVDALSIREEEEDIEDEIEVDDVDVDVDVDMDMGSDAEGIDVKQDADTDLGGTVGDVQDNLEAALAAARQLGDEKLEDQIGNTLTFFTRQHVVKEADLELDVNRDETKEEAELGLEEIARMKKIAGIK